MSRSQVWFTADTHYSHANIIKYCNRPFFNVQDMNDALVDGINSRVAEYDTLYHLGDWAFGKDNVRMFRNQLNCRNIVLVLGNHDKDIRNSSELQKLFSQIYDSYKEVRINGQDITLCHYAMRVWSKSHHGAWHLYGHSHGSLTDDPSSLSFDIGVDCWGFKPLSFDEVKDVMSKKNFSPIDHHTGVVPK